MATSLDPAKLAALDLRAFAERVSARSEAPGSGSVAALVGALGASAASMAFRHASGEGESRVPAYMAGRAEELDELRERLIELVDRDAEAYAKIAHAADPARKDVLSAFDAPLETVEAALAAQRLLAVGLAQVPERVLAECAVAVHALGAALEGGAAVCQANLALLSEAERAPREASLVFLRRQGAALSREVLEGLRSRGATA